ncbi:cysteine hydrolase family protein [Pseudomonas fluorescens]|uniref:Isochorismatase family protein YecD n=1 Tax=Pseudomonas fluorescens TaxID=294 RepID=A0A5E7BAC5_PSEFL|nr:cysteine hydrolase [Pseudomonas fluorescens]VVN83321.1 Isochorismatase family protein YecD [Pseudomonas fluorescens]
MSRPTVLALHYQNDVLHPDGRIRVGLGADDPARSAVLDAAVRLEQGARARGWPIIHVRVAYRPDYADLLQNAPILRAVAASGAVQEGSWGAQFHDALRPLESPDEFVVTHTRINAFYGTVLDTLLRQLDARQLLIAGVATHSVVESTVRHAVDCGFEVTVLADACAAAQSATHLAALESMRLIATISDVESALEQTP